MYFVRLTKSTDSPRPPLPNIPTYMYRPNKCWIKTYWPELVIAFGLIAKMHNVWLYSAFWQVAKMQLPILSNAFCQFAKNLFTILGCAFCQTDKKHGITPPLPIIPHIICTGQISVELKHIEHNCRYRQNRCWIKTYQPILVIPFCLIAKKHNVWLYSAFWQIAKKQLPTLANAFCQLTKNQFLILGCAFCQTDKKHGFTPLPSQTFPLICIGQISVELKHIYQNW